MKVFGKNAVKELLKSNKIKVNKIFIDEKASNSDFNFFRELANLKHIEVEKVNKQFIENKSGEINAQGIMAVCEEYIYSDLDLIVQRAKEENRNLFILILDCLEDPHNLGSVLRVAECAKIDAVVIAKNRSVLMNETALKVSAGAGFYVDVCKVNNIHQTIESLKKQGIFVYSADMDGKNMYDVNLKGNLALVVGGEGAGVSQLTRNLCDGIISIPMYGEINSLNASVSAGIVIYEAIRQRNF